MEVKAGTLDQRIDERQRDLRVYEEAKERIAQGSLRQSDQWWIENAPLVGRAGTLLGRKIAPPG